VRLPRQVHYLLQGVPAERRLSTTRLCAILALDSLWPLHVLLVMVGRHRALVGLVSFSLSSKYRVGQNVSFTIYGFPSIVVSAQL
jgi:hypothetical protein